MMLLITTVSIFGILSVNYLYQMRPPRQGSIARKQPENQPTFKFWTNNRIIHIRHQISLLAHLTLPHHDQPFITFNNQTLHRQRTYIL